jgi:hypothetical protein
MSGIRGLGSTGNDPYNVHNVGTESESLNQTPAIKPDMGGNIQAEGIGTAQGIESPSETKAEQSKERIEREKKGLQEAATERIAEEQLKAQMKQTQLSDTLDSDDQLKANEASPKDNQRKDLTAINWKDPNEQATPLHHKDGSLQRWSIHDKQWE